MTFYRTIILGSNIDNLLSYVVPRLAVVGIYRLFVKMVVISYL